MASYPGAVKTFTTKNAGDTIQPADVNDLQDEVNAIEAGLLNGTANLNSSASTLASLSVTGGSTLAGGLQSSNSTVNNLSVAGNSTFVGTALFSSLVRATAQPRCSVYNSVSQTIGVSTDVALTFNSQDYNVGSMHSTTTTPTRVTIPTGSSGLYTITGVVAFQGFSTNADCRATIMKNGITGKILAQNRLQLLGIGFTQTLTIAGDATLDAGDYVELYAYYGGTGNLATGDNAARIWQNQFQVKRDW